MQIQAQFKLTLSLGLDALETTQPIQITTDEMEMKMVLRQDKVKHYQKYGGVHAQIEYDGTGMLLIKEAISKSNSCFVPIAAQHTDKQNPDIQTFPFDLSLLQNNQQLSLKVVKHSIKFSLTSLPKAKFISNQQLSSAINGPKDWGLLSMDKAQRILIEKQDTNMPVIGVWTKDFQQTGQSIQIFARFLLRSLPKKCLFLRGTKTYFYAVKMKSNKTSPELFIVQWSKSQSSKQQLWSTKHQQNLVFDSSQKSSFEFTLRSDEKLPQKLMQIECSPIKPSHLTDLWYIQTEKKQPDSPRFHEDIEDPQKLALKRRIHEQQAQIEALKAELCRSRQQLRAVSRNSRPSSKRLTQKDLDIQSLSTNRSTTRHQSSNGSSGASQVITENEPWERFQLHY